MSQAETIIVGNREFTCVRMNAFAANKLLMRLQKVAVPVIGALMGAGKDLGDVDVKVAAQVIAENLDESVMDNIVLPMFAEARVYCVETKTFIKNGTNIDQCFTTENLFDLYELVFEIGRYQFGPFFVSVMGRFGSLTAAKTPAHQSQAPSTRG
jgi:hypothetical protein